MFCKICVCGAGEGVCGAGVCGEGVCGAGVGTTYAASVGGVLLVSAPPVNGLTK